MNNLHPIFATALSPFAPPPESPEADDENAESPSMFADSREDYGYEIKRQRTLDNEESTC